MDGHRFCQAAECGVDVGFSCNHDVEGSGEPVARTRILKESPSGSCHVSNPIVIIP